MWRTVNEMHGRKKIRQFMQPAVYRLRSRHPNSPRTVHVPATVELGWTLGRLRKQQAKVLASEIEMLCLYIILILLLIVLNQFDIYIKHKWIKSENISINLKHTHTHKRRRKNAFGVRTHYHFITFQKDFQTVYVLCACLTG